MSPRPVRASSKFESQAMSVDTVLVEGLMGVVAVGQGRTAWKRLQRRMPEAEVMVRDQRGLVYIEGQQVPSYGKPVGQPMNC